MTKQPEVHNPNLDLTEAEDQSIADRISFVLEHFPIVSPSMLQMVIGTKIPATRWHPILDRMIELKIVYRYTKAVIHPGSGNYGEVVCISLHPPKTPE